MTSSGHIRWGAGVLSLAVAALSVLLVAGCASSATPTAVRSTGSAGSTGGLVVLRDDANGKTVHAQVGQTVQLILGSSYWQVSGSSVPGVLRQDGTTTALPRPASCPNIPGLGCVPVSTSFTAMTPGTSSITAGRTTCGEAMRCAPNQEHFAVTVVVQ
jgi:hypothetical protein